jgi:hypothetical protein
MHRFEDSLSIRDRINRDAFSASWHMQLNNKVIDPDKVHQDANRTNF